MKGNFGRTRRISVVAVTGNHNGLAGFALAKSTEIKGALRQAKNRAGQKLMNIDIYNGHTGKYITILLFVIYKFIFTYFFVQYTMIFLHNLERPKSM